MTQSQFESPLMPRAIADAPDIENVPPAAAMYTLQETVLGMYNMVREIRGGLAAARPQIAATVPAQRTQDGYGGVGTPESLGERLRALVTEPHLDVLCVKVTHNFVLAIADEADQIQALAAQLQSQVETQKGIIQSWQNIGSEYHLGNPVFVLEDLRADVAALVDDAKGNGTAAADRILALLATHAVTQDRLAEALNAADSYGNTFQRAEIVLRHLTTEAVS